MTSVEYKDYLLFVELFLQQIVNFFIAYGGFIDGRSFGFILLVQLRFSKEEVLDAKKHSRLGAAGKDV